MQSEKSIKALIRLIDDPDENIYRHVRDELMSYGTDAVPFLESSWEKEDYDLIFQRRIEQIVHDIQFEDVKTQLQLWLNSEDKNLLKGAITLAKYQYPGLDETLIYDEINKIKTDVWLELNPKQTAFEQIKILNKVFFSIHGFHGDSKHFHSPMNSYINTVVESRKGNPLSLSLIYSVVAQELGMPVFGVNLPNHFVLAYMDDHNTGLFAQEKSKYGVLFYINAFSRGNILNEKAIADFLDSLKIDHKREYFEPCSNSAILKRMITNLINSYQQVGNKEKIEELSELREMIP